MRKSKTQIPEDLKRVAHLEREVEELNQINKRLSSDKEELNSKLNSLNMEYVHLGQTVRSLHWALNNATCVIRKFQINSGQFDYKSKDWVALAE